MVQVNAFVMKHPLGDGGVYRGSQEHRVAQQKYLNSLGKLVLVTTEDKWLRAERILWKQRKVCPGSDIEARCLKKLIPSMS